jgi:metal-responsive CopG/Arc/MetJ family transcriptional regulator
METIQVVLDAKLLRETDEAAKGARVNRSELVRRALREHLKRIRVKELEERDRRGYQERPDSCKELEFWERAAAWPDR